MRMRCLGRGGPRQGIRGQCGKVNGCSEGQEEMADATISVSHHEMAVWLILRVLGE